MSRKKNLKNYTTMNNLKKIILAAICLCSCNTLFSQQLLVGGSGWGKIAVIDKESKDILWEYPLMKGWECNNVVALKNGNVLFSYKKGAKVITMSDKKDVWNITAPEGTEMQSAKLLPNGNCLLAISGTPLVILEVDAETGEVLERVEYDTKIANPHAQVRQINKMKNGNYIIPLVSQPYVDIVSPEGQLVKKIDVAGTPFSTDNIKGDLYWVAGGDGHQLSEVNFKTGETIRVIEDEDIPGAPIYYVAGIESNKKSFYLCSWQGHSKGKTGPKILELDNDLNILWSVEDENSEIGRISAVCSIKYKK